MLKSLADYENVLLSDRTVTGKRPVTSKRRKPVQLLSPQVSSRGARLNKSFRGTAASVGKSYEIPAKKQQQVQTQISRNTAQRRFLSAKNGGLLGIGAKSTKSGTHGTVSGSYLRERGGTNDE